MTASILRYILMLIMGLLMPGIINRTKALWAGRQGAPVLQPVYDICRLLSKSQVISSTTSKVFLMAPSVTFASILTAGLLVPVAGRGAVLHFNGDFVFFAYMLGLGRFFTIAAALDTGSSFEGMGASREMTFSALIEPAFFIVAGSLAILAGATSFSEIFAVIPAGLPVTEGAGFVDSFVLAVNAWSGSGLLIPVICGNIVLLIMILVEAGRIPVDDPNTHLELTMVHEVMVLDNSGPDLAMINAGSAIKIAIFSSLIAGLTIPSMIHPAAGIVLYAAIMGFIAVFIGTIESVMARLRMTHVPQFILAATSVALIVLAVLLIGGHK